jgi:hypothetical protein
MNSTDYSEGYQQAIMDRRDRRFRLNPFRGRSDEYKRAATQTRREYLCFADRRQRRASTGIGRTSRKVVRRANATVLGCIASGSLGGLGRRNSLAVLRCTATPPVGGQTTNHRVSGMEGSRDSPFPPTGNVSGATAPKQARPSCRN